MLLQKERYLPKTRRLGEILIHRQLLTPENLKTALQIQKRQKKYLGEILVDLDYVDERDIVVALVIQCKVPYIAVDKYDIDVDILRMVPGDVVRKHRVMPLDKVGGVLSLVMSDPLNIDIRNELENITHCRVAPFIGLSFEIEKAIDRWYGQES